jgi:malonyl-CoA O-methyltransferase
MPPSEAQAPPAPRRVDAAAFTRLLKHADAGEAPWLHQEVARRMAERLPILRIDPARVIDWWGRRGGGTALLQAHLLERLQARTQAPAVDPTAATTAAIPRPHTGPVELLTVEPAATAHATGSVHEPPKRADGLTRWLPGWIRRSPAATVTRAERHEGDTPDAPGQLLWSNMALHWHDELPALLQRWQAWLAVDGMLMFSCFGPDTLASLRRVYQQCGWGVPASAFTDMHDVGDALVAAGFAEPVMDMEMIRLSWPDAASLLAELRSLGRNTAPTRFAGLRTPRWRARLEAALAARLRQADGRLQLEFEIVYGHAVRVAPRLAVKSSTTISADALREMARQGQRKRGDGATP